MVEVRVIGEITRELGYFALQPRGLIWIGQDQSRKIEIFVRKSGSRKDEITNNEILER